MTNTNWKKDMKSTHGENLEKNNICCLQDFLQNAVSHQLLYNKPFKICLLNQWPTQGLPVRHILVNNKNMKNYKFIWFIILYKLHF